MTVVQVILALAVLSAAGISLICAGFVFLAAVEAVRSHHRKARPYFPRTVVIVPAHNEALVLERTIDAMVSQRFPVDALKVLVVDDASTDSTGELVARMMVRHPGRIEYERRLRGGEGKAAVLNTGLDRVLRADWAQAVLIIDADVIFEPDAVGKMTRHLADPEVGAVGGYVREGSSPGNSLSRFIGFEYVLAQALARRAANVMGVFGCVPGGAQLHSRENLERLGGRIDDSTKAEDTVTTFLTQLHGRKVVFEGRAVCWAEEPERMEGLWKQRLRWARGNLQVISKFRSLWFRRTTPVGRWSFGEIWFAVALQPAFMLLNSLALSILWLTDFGLAGELLRTFWIVNALCWVVLAAFGLLADRTTARKSWLQCFTFPGMVSLAIIVYTLLPRLFVRGLDDVLAPVGASVPGSFPHWFVLFAALWTSACMAVAAAARKLDAPGGVRRRLAGALLYIGGYGPLLCAVGVAAYLDHFRGVERRWEVTVKTGRVRRGGEERGPLVLSRGGVPSGA